MMKENSMEENKKHSEKPKQENHGTQEDVVKKGESPKLKQVETELETTKKHLEDLQKQYIELNTKASQYLNTASYYKNQADETKADFERFKTRNKNIEADANKKASEQMAKKLLPIIDDFDQAMLKLSPEIMKGFSMIYSSLCAVLESLGVSEIFPKDEPLDPNKHNCIDTVKTDDKSLDDKIAKVYQKGYMFADTGKVIRPATVSVYKANL